MARAIFYFYDKILRDMPTIMSFSHLKNPVMQNIYYYSHLTHKKFETSVEIAEACIVNEVLS